MPSTPAGRPASGLCEAPILVIRYMYARRFAPPPQSGGPGFEFPSFVLWICCGFRPSDFKCGCGHRPQCELRHGRRDVSATVRAPVGAGRACGVHGVCMRAFLVVYSQQAYRRRHTGGGAQPAGTKPATGYRSPEAPAETVATPERSGEKPSDCPPTLCGPSCPSRCA